MNRLHLFILDFSLSYHSCPTNNPCQLSPSFLSKWSSHLHPYQHFPNPNHIISQQDHYCDFTLFTYLLSCHLQAILRVATWVTWWSLTPLLLCLRPFSSLLWSLWWSPSLIFVDPYNWVPTYFPILIFHLSPPRLFFPHHASAEMSFLLVSKLSLFKTCANVRSFTWQFLLIPKATANIPSHLGTCFSFCCCCNKLPIF